MALLVGKNGGWGEGNGIDRIHLSSKKHQVKGKGMGTLRVFNGASAA